MVSKCVRPELNQFSHIVGHSVSVSAVRREQGSESPSQEAYIEHFCTAMAASCRASEKVG